MLLSHKKSSIIGTLLKVVRLFEDAAAKFNDVDFVPESMALPDLHNDFAVSKKLYILVDEIDAEDVKKWVADCHGKLINVKNAWQQQGHGNCRGWRRVN
jgi:hypothetical protein